MNDTSSPEFFETNPEATKIEKPRMLTKAELLSGAKAQFADKIKKGDLTEAQVDTFVQSKVTGIKINGTDVLSIDFEHEDSKVDPVAKAYIESSRTKTVVAEYFKPELDANGVYSGISGRAIKGMEAYNRMLKKYHKVGKHLTELPVTRDEYSENLASLCQASGKSVTVMDIANKPSFVAVREAIRSIPGFVGGSVGALEASHNPVIAVLAGALSAGLPNLAFVRLRKMDKSIFSKDKLMAKMFEHFIVDFEQARRLIVANGMRQLTQEYQSDLSTQPEIDSPQIVSFYPKAHSMRVEEFLVNRWPHIDKTRGVLYKALAPFLDYERRKYDWDANLNKWSLDSKTKIKA